MLSCTFVGLEELGNLVGVRPRRCRRRTHPTVEVGVHSRLQVPVKPLEHRQAARLAATQRGPRSSESHARGCDKHGGGTPVASEALHLPYLLFLRPTQLLHIVRASAPPGALWDAERCAERACSLLHTHTSFVPLLGARSTEAGVSHELSALLGRTAARDVCTIETGTGLRQGGRDHERHRRNTRPPRDTQTASATTRRQGAARGTHKAAFTAAHIVSTHTVTHRETRAHYVHTTHCHTALAADSLVSLWDHSTCIRLARAAQSTGGRASLQAAAQHSESVRPCALSLGKTVGLDSATAQADKLSRCCSKNDQTPCSVSRPPRPSPHAHPRPHAPP